jgi:hypothetical protein
MPRRTTTTTRLTLQQKPDLERLYLEFTRLRRFVERKERSARRMASGLNRQPPLRGDQHEQRAR